MRIIALSDHSVNIKCMKDPVWLQIEIIINVSYIWKVHVITALKSNHLLLHKKLILF